MNFKWLIVATCIALAVLGGAVYKASHSSMTHDESSTFLNYARRTQLNLLSCFSNPDCWGSANNHLLNTVMMRGSWRVLGTSELALRLPNLLLLAIYLVSVIMLLGDTAGTMAISVFGISLLSCNPYVIDFFGLARGYGMGLGLMMLSLFLMWRYMSQRRAWDFVLSYVSATAAVFANLTYVAFIIALTASVLAIVIFPLIRKPRRQIDGMIPLSMAACIIFLCAFFYKPILILSSKGEFEYGTQTLWESWKGFARDSLYGRQWIGEETVLVVSITGAILVLAAMFSVWIPVREDDDTRVVRFGRLMSVLCMVLIAFFIANQVFLGSDYPSGRKSIIYYPVFAMMAYFAIIRYTIPKRLWLHVLCVASGVMLIVHYVKAYSGHSYREWWYDSSTREMVYAVAANAGDESKVKLAVEWIFHPSTHFYVGTRKLPVDLEPYNKDILGNTPADYYYLHPDKATVLEASFEHVQTFEGRWLMRRKE